MFFQDVRTVLAIDYRNNLMDDKEFMLLYDVYKSKNPAYPYWEFGRFPLDELLTSECEAMFRVQRADIPILLDVLRVPETFKCRRGTICDGIEGLCILLKR